MTGHEGPEGEYKYISTLSLKLVLYGVGGQHYTPPALTPGKRPGTDPIGVGWAPGPAWAGAESLIPTWILSPDRPSRSYSLYRLCKINLVLDVYGEVKSAEFLFKD
jgi:hypothetical protein